VTRSEPPETILAELRPSPPRRIIGVAMLGGLGVILLWFGLRFPTDPILWSVFLVAFGGLSIWLSWRMWEASARGLVLTREELRDTSGRRLVALADVRGIDRGVFAVKPAGGFTIVTANAEARAWEPGLWWRLGRRIGIGGVTHRHEGRYMAEVLVEIIEARKRA
jgi:hypothetical protein